MSTIRRSSGLRWFGLGLACLALGSNSIWGLAAAAGSDEAPTVAHVAQQPVDGAAETGRKPAANSAEETLPPPQPPRLESPQAEAGESEKSAGPEPQKPSEKPAGGEGQKPSEEAPGGLRLEPPREAPVEPGEAPKVAPPKRPEGPRAMVIEEIIFRGNRRIPAATLRARIFSHKGDLYDENALERDFMALWNTGFLDDVRLEVSEGESGKIVTFYVREKKLIRSIDYKGLSSIAQSDVLETFKKQKVGLSIQSQYDPVIIKRAEVILQEMLAAQGRQFARVRSRTRNIPPNSVALTFIVNEGPKVKVGDIRFEGNTVFSDRRLERAMKMSRPIGLPPWFYWFHRTYDREKVLYDLEQVRDLYRDNGYFYALPREPQTKMTDTKRRLPFFFFSWGRGKRVDLSIPLEEGDQYRLGRFVIRGNKLFKQEQLAFVLPMKPGDIFSLGKVRKSLEDYRKLYGQFGYINFTASPDIEPDNKRKLIHLALDFEEEKQYFVHRIEFSGNTKTRDKVVRRELLLDEGNIFNTTLWDLSVLRVNQLGFFDSIKKEDYEIKQNPKEGTIDITLKVKEKGRNSIGFSGGASGYAGNFVGFNYATNNFLGLGETLSFQMQWGTYQKLYSFGFTEPYLFDRPITTGFTVFRSDYRYDQARQTAFYTGIDPSALEQTPYGQYYFQNFQQNSSGFTVFASYPLPRSFARVGLSYTYSVSSLQAFSSASQAYFSALMFRGLEGPSALTGITSSQITPTYVYNTINDPWNPSSGKYLYAGLSFSGSLLGGNVNTIRPVVEAKYFRPVMRKRSERPIAIGMRFMTSMVSGFGGKVAPPFSRFYVGGEDDIRGFDIRSVSPVAFYPTVREVCNRDNFGNPIWALDSYGSPIIGQCGSATRAPYYAPLWPGGDTMAIANFEYRIPVAGPVTLAYFLDVGTNFVWRTSQLKVIPRSLDSIREEFPFFKLPTELKPIAVTNFRPRASTGLEIQVILPIVNAPFRVFYGYNFLRLNHVITPPQDYPPVSLFPNQATYLDALSLFQSFLLLDRKSRLGFTVARTF